MCTHFLLQTPPPREPNQLPKLYKVRVLPVNDIRVELAFIVQVTLQIVEVQMNLVGVLAL